MKRHFENLTDKVGRAVQHWWLLMLAGILCFACGIAVFAFPLESYVVISILVGVVMLFTGAAQLIIASSSGNYPAMRGYMIVGGIVDLLLGLFIGTDGGDTEGYDLNTAQIAPLLGQQLIEAVCHFHGVHGKIGIDNALLKAFSEIRLQNIRKV